MHILELNHIALHVADVDTSVRFYSQTLRLQALLRPNFDFPGAWFRLGVTQELHLIGDRQHAVDSHHRGNHVAFAVDDLDEWDAHLDLVGARRLPRRTRPDGVHQTFLIDPDGHWIELCQVHSSSLSKPTSDARVISSNATT